MPVLTGTKISHSNGQTETGAETEYTTLIHRASSQKKKKNIHRSKYYKMLSEAELKDMILAHLLCSV